jgi:hypothetical protein
MNNFIFYFFLWLSLIVGFCIASSMAAGRMQDYWRKGYEAGKQSKNDIE